MSSEEWCTIESDPGVFTELLEEVGVKHVELTELWSLDDDSLSELSKSAGGNENVYGLIFLFRWTPGTAATSAATPFRTPLEDVPEGLFFAKQVTTNACATQALLSVVLNADSNNKPIELGNTLDEFKSFTASFPPDLVGEAIGASDELKRAHNRFARPDAAFLAPETRAHSLTADETDVFHFVAYIPRSTNEPGDNDNTKTKAVYELDGLKSGPILIGKTTDNNNNSNDDWMKVARTAIQERMERLGDGEIKFNLMAVIRDKRQVLQEQLDAATSSVDDDTATALYQSLQAQLQAEHAKRHAWTLENQRRQFNYVPLCMQLLKELARNGSLPQLTAEARERIQAKRNAAIAKQQQQQKF